MNRHEKREQTEARSLEAIREFWTAYKQIREHREYRIHDKDIFKIVKRRIKRTIGHEELLIYEART